MKLEWLDHERQARTPLTYADLDAVGVRGEVLSGDAAVDQPRLRRLMEHRGYVEQDVVELCAETPDLDVLTAKFVAEHRHTDDEVRYVLEGEGIFDLRARDDAWMRVTVVPGDLLVVPAELNHRFMLTDVRSIRCVRLFKDRSGWVPLYRASTSVPEPSP